MTGSKEAVIHLTWINQKINVKKRLREQSFFICRLNNLVRRSIFKPNRERKYSYDK